MSLHPMAEERVQRRLAAILVCRRGRLQPAYREGDEGGTLAVLKDRGGGRVVVPLVTLVMTGASSK